MKGKSPLFIKGMNDEIIPIPNAMQDLERLYDVGNSFRHFADAISDVMLAFIAAPKIVDQYCLDDKLQSLDILRDVMLDLHEQVIKNQSPIIK